MAKLKKLNPNLWHISLPFLDEDDIVGAYLLSGKDELALIDPGPEKSADDLLAGIREAGFQPQDITHILVTHIHLDHSGAVGTIIRQMPQAQVYVHSIGAPHMIDTSKLVASASRVYGDQMETLWGKVESVAQDHVHAIEGGDVLNVADRRFEVHYTPGHAIHHVVFFDVHSGELFSGDVAGIHLEGVDYVRPPTPPPDVDIEAWSSSIDLLKKLRPDLLYLAHYGAAKNPTPLLESLRANLLTWGDIVLKAMRENKSNEEIAAILQAQTEPELQRKAKGNPHMLKLYDITSSYQMTTAGIVRYWRKHHPERL